MIEAGGMGNKERGHSQNLVAGGAKWKCRTAPKPTEAEVPLCAKVGLRQRNLADAVSSLNHLAFESRGSGHKVLRKEPRDRNAGLGLRSGADRRQRLLGQ